MATFLPPGMDVTSVLDFVRANPLVLVPLVLLAAMAVYALIKRLLKIVFILAIALFLYVAIVQYLGA